MALDPWSYAAKTRNEYAEQVSLIMWANMACSFGLAAADNPDTYQTPGMAKALRDEHRDQIPALHWLHAIKNAGHGDAIRGAMSKAEGVKAGVPDLFLPVPSYWNNLGATKYCGLYIELKRLKSERGAAGKSSELQIKWQSYLTGVGYRVEVCTGWLEARQAILAYLGKV